MKYTAEQRRRFGEIIREESKKKQITWPEDYAANLNRVAVSEETVTGRHGDFSVWVIRPEEDLQIRALHINLHGGGFIKPHGQRDILFSAMIALSVPCVVVDVAYHTTDLCKYPIPFDDCYDAALWAVKKAEELGIGPDRVTIGGHSAGATMAASCVIRGKETGEFLPCGQILDYGNFDLSVPPSQKPVIPGGRLSPDRMSMSVSLLTEDDPDVLESPYCSVLKATDGELTGMPKTLIIAAGKCPFREEDRAYADRLSACGNDVTFVQFENSDHGFIISLEGEWRKAQDLIVSELRRMADES